MEKDDDVGYGMHHRLAVLLCRLEKSCFDMRYNTVLTIAFAVTLLFAVGCGKKEAPDVPSARSSTLFEIYRLMDARQYRPALSLVEKYHSMDPTNEFLNELKLIIHTNIAVQEAESFAQKGKLKEACEHLDKCVEQFGELPGILEAKKIYLELQEMGDRIQILKKPVGSYVMRKNADWLAGYARKYRNVQLQRFADGKIRESKEVAKLEIDRAGFYVYADAMEQLAQGNLSQAQALTALLIVERRYPVNVQRIQNGGMYDASYLENMVKKQQGDTRPDLKTKVK